VLRYSKGSRKLGIGAGEYAKVLGVNPDRTSSGFCAALERCWFTTPRVFRE
jgi:hypothetical protein